MYSDRGSYLRALGCAPGRGEARGSPQRPGSPCRLDGLGNTVALRVRFKHYQNDGPDIRVHNNMVPYSEYRVDKRQV